jgi:hypothetical protein
MSKAEVIYDKVQMLPDSAQAALLRVVESLTENASASEPQLSSPLARRFRELAEIWRRETAYFSFMQQRMLHPAYQHIIGMGWPVVPLLLRELQRQPDHWLWALQAITGEEPARGTDTLGAAAEAWLNWGRQRGLLPNAQG